MRWERRTNSSCDEMTDHEYLHLFKAGMMPLLFLANIIKMLANLELFLVFMYLAASGFRWGVRDLSFWHTSLWVCELSCSAVCGVPVS